MSRRVATVAKSVWSKSFALFLLATILTAAEAGAPRLVRDINVAPAPHDSNPVFVGSLSGSQLFWTAPGIFDGKFSAGRLWASNGTTAGTRLLVDLRDPTVSIPDIPYFSSAQQVGNRAFFSAPTASFRNEIWVTDGSPEGTRSLQVPGQPSTGIASYYVVGSVGDDVIFGGGGGATSELWVGDGHAANTRRLTNISSLAGVSIDGVLAIVGSKIYFRTRSSCCGLQFWVVSTDGSAMTPVSGPPTSSYREAIRVGNYLFLLANDQISGNEVWAIDTRSDSIALVRDINPGRDNSVSGSPAPWAAPVGNSIVFSGESSSVGTELWRTDGSEAGTYLLKDIWPGGISSLSSNASFTSLNGRVLFIASDGTTYDQIWSTDGTADGTVRLTTPAFNFNEAGPLFKVADRAYFPMGNGNTADLWVTDGTPTGTRRVNNIAVSQTSFILGDSSSVFVHETQDLGGQSRSNRLWHYNPATGEAFLLKTYTGSESTKPAFLNGRLYFSVTDSAGHEPWVSDGTVAGTHMLKDIEARTTASASPDELVAIGSEVFFVANDGTTSRELWKSDGTGAGTKQLVDLLSSPAYSAPTKLTAFNGMLYFFGLNATLSPTFWSVRPDGSSLTSLASLRPPTDKAPYFATACNASVAATVGATMYFSASSLLYRTDGTAAGTTRVAAATPYGEPCELTTLGGRVYFSADGGPNGGGRELWSSDGTSAGTVRVADILSGSAGSSPTQLAAIGQTLFFAATDAAGPRIFKSDGTAAGTVPLDSVPHSEPWLSVSRLMPVGATLFFLVKVDAPSTVPEVAQFQLWKTDGTAAGTIRVGDSITARRNATRGIGNRLYFTSSSAATGIEPWIVDSSGARLLEDLNAGGDSDPSWFANFNDIALFEARNADGASGLWRSSVVLPTPKLLGEIDSSPISVKYHPNRVIAGGKFFFVSESESLGSELHVVENESPAAVADGARATSGVETIIAVDGNDADPDGAVDPAGIRITTHPANGVASVVNGHIAYRSTAGFVGTDTLNYTIDDDQGQTSAPAPVTITVEAAPAVSPPSPSPPSGGSRGGGGAADLLLLLALAVPRFNRVRWSARVENEVQ